MSPSQDSSVTYRPIDRKRFLPIAVKDGNTSITGLVIKVRRDLLAISGRVVDSTTKPIADAVVTIEPSGTPAVVMTNDTGSFTFEGLAA